MIACYLINLDRSLDRLAYAERQFERLGLQFERVAGVDGAQMSNEARENFAAPTRRPRWLPGQIGCFLSHCEAWRRASEHAEPWTAVFEDDNVISAALPRFLASDTWIPGDADIVRLETTGHGVRSRRVGVHADRDIRRVVSPSWGAGAYLIRRDIARLLLATPERWHAPVDRMLFDQRTSALARVLRIFQVSPALSVQQKYHAAEAAPTSLIDGADYDVSRQSGWWKAFRPIGRAALGLKPTPFA